MPGFHAAPLQRPRRVAGVAAVVLAAGLHAWLLQRDPLPTAAADPPGRTVLARAVPPAATPAEAPPGLAPAAPPPVAPRPARTDRAARVPPTAHAAAKRRRDVDQPPVPLWQPPDPVDLPYRWQQGTRSGEARLRWWHDGQRYTLELQLDGRWHQRSAGLLGPAGPLPERHTERRAGRSERALSVVRAADEPASATLSFSGRTEVQAAPPGLQDGLSWLAHQAGSTPTETALAQPIATVDGLLRTWTWEWVDVDTEGAHWRRPPTLPFEPLLEIWLPTAGARWPLALRWVSANGAEPLTLRAVRDAPGTPPASSPGAAPPK